MLAPALKELVRQKTQSTRAAEKDLVGHMGSYGENSAFRYMGLSSWRALQMSLR